MDIRNLRADHLGRLIAVEGLARKVTTVKPRMTLALFRCARCGTEMWVPQPGMLLKEPMMCSNPEGSCNKQATRFILDDKASVFIDTQKIEIQESPEGLRGGAQPERITGYVEDDIAGEVTAGNRITLNGILRSVEKTDRDKSTVFETFLDVISVEFEQHEYDEIQITEDDEREILRMSKDPDLFDNIVRSISPSIYGLDSSVMTGVILFEYATYFLRISTSYTGRMLSVFSRICFGSTPSMRVPSGIILTWPR